jgi:hypothetical protein
LVLGGLPDEAKGATAVGGGNPHTVGYAPPPEQNAEGEQAAKAEFPAPVLGGLPYEQGARAEPALQLESRRWRRRRAA